MSYSASFDVNEWNPLKEAYNNTDFNSYDCGPGKYLTMGERKNKHIDVFVKHLPEKFTEDGLRALFSMVGKVQRATIHRQNTPSPYGFVSYVHLKEAQAAISKFNNLQITGNNSLFVKLSFKDEQKLKDRLQRMDDYSDYSDSERPQGELFKDKHAQHLVSSAYSSCHKHSRNHCSKETQKNHQHSRNYCSKEIQKNQHSRNHCSKETQKNHLHQEKNARGHGNFGSFSDKCCCHEADEEFTLPKSSEMKNSSKSSPKNSHGSNDSGMLQLKKQCANCGSEATKRCSRCKTPYCSMRCQEKAWMNGHQNECFSFSNMSLQELAERFDVDLDLNSSANKSSLKGSHSPKRSNNQHKRSNSSSSNKKVSHCSPKSDTNVSKHDKSSKKESDIEDVSIDKWFGSIIPPTESAQRKTAARSDSLEKSSPCHTLSDGDSQELETVELPSRGTSQVLVTYVDKLNIYVQLSTEENQNIQKEILCKLYKSCEDDSTLLRNTKSMKIGQLYACMFSEDSVWYRAILVEILKSDRVKVKYIDFGNCEVTTIDKLRVLSPELMKIPQQAVCCVLSFPPEVTSQHFTKLAALIGKHILQDSQYLLKVVTDSIPPKVYIYDDEGNRINKKIVNNLEISNEAYTNEISKTIGVNTPQLENSPPVMACDVALVPTNLKYGSNYKVNILDVKSPENFLVQLADEPSRAFHQFTKKLNSYAESYSPSLTRPLKGQLVLTKLETQDWARAEVMDVKNESLMVFLIDFGTEEVVCLEDYRSAMPFCLDYPCLRIPSKLEGVNSLGRKDDSLKLCRRFNRILKLLIKSDDFSKEYFLGSYMGCENKICQWNLYDPIGENSIIDMLASSLKVMASDLKGFQINVGDVLDGLAVEILTDSFYIIVASEKQISFLEEFNTYLEKKDNGIGYTPCIDEMVAAKFSQDNQWYRGQIISISDGKYKVFFVDYGNSEYVDELQLQPFPEHYAHYPKQALHCYLSGIHNIKDNEKFSQLVCNNVCKYKIEGCTKNVFEVVVYTGDGSCVNECFEENLEKVVSNDSFPLNQSLNGTATSKSNSMKSASSLSLSPIRSHSQSSQSSIGDQQVEELSPIQLSHAFDSPFSSRPYHGDSSDYIFEKQCAEKDLPDDRQTKESIVQSLSRQTSKQEPAYQDDVLPRLNRVRHFAKNMGILQLKVNMKYELLCKWVTDVDCFYCQLHDDVALEALSDITEQLNEICGTPHGKLNILPEIGEVICAKNSDGKWYRAKITAVVSEAEYIVFYIDFGCSSTVSQDEILPLTDELAEIPILAARCSLAGKSKEKWTKEKLRQLREHPIAVEVVGETHNSYSVVFKEDIQDKNTMAAVSSSIENISSKEKILQQIEMLKCQLELMD